MVSNALSRLIVYWHGIYKKELAIRVHQQHELKWKIERI